MGVDGNQGREEGPPDCILLTLWVKLDRCEKVRLCGDSFKDLYARGNGVQEGTGLTGGVVGGW